MAGSWVRERPCEYCSQERLRGGRTQPLGRLGQVVRNPALGTEAVKGRGHDPRVEDAHAHFWCKLS